MTWRRRHSVGTVFLILAIAFYIYFLHRTVDVKQVDGWKLRFSYLYFHCRVCRGRVEELSYDGRPVTVPDWNWQAAIDLGKSTTTIHTPVGDFGAFKGAKTWRLLHPVSVEELPESVSAEELAQGWYNAVPPDSSDFIPGFGPFVKKQGTPSHWCLVATFNAGRWLSPDKIDHLKW